MWDVGKVNCRCDCMTNTPAPAAVPLGAIGSTDFPPPLPARGRPGCCAHLLGQRAAGLGVGSSLENEKHIEEQEPHRPRQSD